MTSEYLDWSFNELVDHLTDMRLQLEEAKTARATAEAALAAFNADEELGRERQQSADLTEILEEWIDVANDLYEGLLVAQEQLVKHGVGLRPVAQKAVTLFLSMTEEDDG
jgi:hypothetical protein